MPTELSDPSLIAEKDKHYFLRRGRIDEPEPTDRNDFDYGSYLPIAMSHEQLGETVSIPFR